MSEHETGQVAASAAEIYEQFFVPALFIDWPAHVLAAADVQPGDSVLDVACGTGVLTRAAADAVAPTGHVTGVDLNDGMLAVAKASAPALIWKQGAAEALPFEDNSFDKVVSQFGLMFFQDQEKAISEMRRVARPGGKVAVAVWASLADTPGYQAVADMLNDLFGPEIAKSIEMPYALGDTDVLRSLFVSAGIEAPEITTSSCKVRFESIDAWVYTDIKGWTLADVIDDEGFAELQAAAPKWLSPFVLDNGAVEFDGPAHIVSFTA